MPNSGENLPWSRTEMESLYRLYFYRRNCRVFPNWGYTNPPLPPPTLSFAHILMDDAQWAGTNSKSIFRFLFFELQSTLFTILKCFYTNKHKILHTIFFFKSGQIYMKAGMKCKIYSCTTFLYSWAWSILCFIRNKTQIWLHSRLIIHEVQFLPPFVFLW